MKRERARFDEYGVEDTPIAKGGVGSIHRTDDPAFVWKRYFSADKAPPWEHLDRLVEVGRQVLVAQGKKPGQTPESSVNWPVDMAVDGQGRVTGVLLPAIPPELFTPEHNKVRTLDFLVMRRARPKPPPAVARIVLLLRMAEILAFVDGRKLIHGDINAKNLAWAVAGVPEAVMYLIDCDGMVPQDPAPARGVAAAGWVDPRLQDKLIPAHDKYSDRYALALAMYRGLLLTTGNLARDDSGRWAGPTAIPEDFPQPLTALLRRALSDPTNALQRPAAREWVDTLVQVYLPDGTFDDAKIASLETLTAQVQDPSFVRVPKIPQPQTARQQQPVVTNPGWPPHPPRQQVIPPVPPPPIIPPRPRNRAPISRYPSGGLALTAMEAGPKWYVLGVLAVTMLPIVAIVYIGIALLQLRHGDGGDPTVFRARCWLYVFGSVALGMNLFPLLITLMSK